MEGLVITSISSARHDKHFLDLFIDSLYHTFQLIEKYYKSVTMFNFN